MLKLPNRFCYACAPFMLVAYSPAQATNPRIFSFEAPPVDQHAVGCGQPYGGVIAGPNGTLLGTTTECFQRGSGETYHGSVYQLSPPTDAKGSWTLGTLHAFGGKNDGEYPRSTLAQAPLGNVFGTTASYNGIGSGTFFQILPTYKILYIFTSSEGGPQKGLVISGSGEVFGTVTSEKGAVYKLSPPSGNDSKWKYSSLYVFTGSPDGDTPSTIVRDETTGIVYGTTYYGGADTSSPCNGEPAGCGTVFELDPPAKGSSTWSKSILHSFSATDGYLPLGGLVRDSKGNLYGTTEGGGSEGSGTVFELTPPSGGQTKWAFTTIFNFGVAQLAEEPASLLLRPDGTLYGTTLYGSSNLGPPPTNYGGTIFRLQPAQNDAQPWTLKILSDFSNSKRGAGPVAPIIDINNVLYGTTVYGGAVNEGTVFGLAIAP